jgi:hypothetical protein
MHKRYLPELEDLVRLRESTNNDKEFIKRIHKGADILLGSEESMDYIEKIEQQLNQDERIYSKNT